MFTISIKLPVSINFAAIASTVASVATNTASFVTATASESVRFASTVATVTATSVASTTAYAAGAAYGVGLWMFAPESVWQREVEQAKANQAMKFLPPAKSPLITPTPLNVITASPVIVPTIIIPTIEPQTIIETMNDVEPIQEPEAMPEALPDASEEPEEIDYNSLTVKELRHLAKDRNIYIKSKASKSRIITILKQA